MMQMWGVHEDKATASNYSLYKCVLFKFLFCFGVYIFGTQISVSVWGDATLCFLANFSSATGSGFKALEGDAWQDLNSQLSKLGL